jgi:hypothetical protein
VPFHTHAQLQASLTKLDALAAKPWSRPPSCDSCQHFQPNPLNPAAGMGRCGASHGYYFARERHSCAYHQSKDSA